MFKVSDFQDAGAPGSTAERLVPDGVHVCKIAQAEIVFSSNRNKEPKKLSPEAVNQLTTWGDMRLDGRPFAVGRTAENLLVVFEVVGGEYAGCVIKKWFVWRHPSTQSMKIGRIQAAKMCEALGLDGFTKAEQMLGRVLNVETVTREPNNGFRAKPEPVAYSAAEGVEQPAVPAPPVVNAAFQDDDVPF